MTIRGARHLLGHLRHMAKKRQRPRKAKYKAYERRSATLSALGYRSYQEYLASDDWATILDKKLEQFPDCLLCDRPASQVHHMNYDDRTMLGLALSQLVTLCRECHEKIEVKEDGTKRTLDEANRVLRRLAHDNHRTAWLKMARRTKREREGRAAPTCPVCRKNQMSKTAQMCGACARQADEPVG